MKRRNVLTAMMAAPITATALSKSANATTADRSMLEDWPNLARYAAQNEAHIASGARTDIVFMGDSITQGWPDKRPAYFGSGRVNRGIGGQTTPQMLLRMMADVIALKPRIVHIMGGTNDVAGNTGPITVQQTVDNLRAMVVLAKCNGIAVLLGSIPPAANFPWRPGLDTIRAIAELNNALFNLAKGVDVAFVDYTPVLSDGTGAMRPGFSYDGVHPDISGYEAMEGVLEPLIAAALGRTLKIGKLR